LFAPKDFNDAQEISNDLGSTTVKGKSHSRPMWGTSKGNSTTESDQRRMLLLPQEVKEIGDHNEIIIYEGIRPIMAEKIIYYKDKHFKKRLLSPPTINRLQLIGNEIAGDQQQKTQSEPHFRSMTIDEIKNIDNMSLADFAINMDSIAKPNSPPMTFEEITSASQRFLNLSVEN
jgi:type IV secretion system protein VirD4